MKGEAEERVEVIRQILEGKKTHILMDFPGCLEDGGHVVGTAEVCTPNVLG